MPLIPALRRKRQVAEFKGNLVYRASCRTQRRNPVSKKKKKPATKKACNYLLKQKREKRFGKKFIEHNEFNTISIHRGMRKNPAGGCSTMN